MILQVPAGIPEWLLPYIARLSSWDIVFLVGAFLVGLFGIPFGIPLAGPSLPFKEKFARIFFTIGQITTGGCVLDRRDSGRYELQPLTETPDGQPAMKRDGELVPLAGHEEHWSRLGKRPFAVTWEKTDESVREYRADIPDEVPPERMADGGDIALLDQQTADVDPLYTPYLMAPEDGWAISMTKVAGRLRTAGGIELVNRSEEAALEEEAGSDRLSTKHRLAGLLGAMAMGVFTGFLMFGGF